MKRIIFAFTLFLIFIMSTGVYAAEVSIDDKNLEFCGHTGFPYIDLNNRTQVPLRIIMESLGADVAWLQEAKTAVIVKGDITVEVPIGKSYIIKNGQQIANDTAAVIRGDRTFIPIRAVLEAYGIQVGWTSETQTVKIDGQSFYGNDGTPNPFIVCLEDHPGDFNVTTHVNYPGNILLLHIKKLNSEDTVSVYTDAVKIKTEIFQNDDHYVAVLPIDLYAAIGDHDISVTFNKGTDNEYKITRTFNIRSKAFKTQYLVVSESLNQTNNNEKANLEYVNIVKPAKTISNNTKLWIGEFIMPVTGRLTTDFAEIRYNNYVLSSSRHSGIDLAAPLGTSVQAPNNGKVTLAASGLLSTGNTIVIDHGMGLFTSYYHLNTMNIKAGDVVYKGDIIGTVGTTGFSTGSHLHYGVSIYNTNVNTYQPLTGLID